MPVTELEKHPYLQNINYAEYESDYFEGLVIGTFPVYSVTDTLTEQNQTLLRFVETDAYMRFFYGSKQNVFWELLSSVLGPANPTHAATPDDRVNEAMNLLTQNKLLITDVIAATNRKGHLSEDKNIWVDTDCQFVLDNRTLNNDIDALLSRNCKIKYLFFTATDLAGKSPFGWFRIIFANRLTFRIITQIDNRVWCLQLNIDGREYLAFMLPSPAGKGTRGIHFGIQRLLMFESYLQSVDQQFYQEIDAVDRDNRTTHQKNLLTSFRKSFLKESWHQALIFKNAEFNGSI